MKIICLGTIINTVLIIAGGLVGLLFGKLFKDEWRESINLTTGVCVLFVGISGAVAGMLNINDGKLETANTMVVIVSLVVGMFIGELLNIEGLFDSFGIWLRAKSNSENDNNFLNGFLTASLTVSVGAMAVVGSIQDGIAGDWTILATKGIIDFVIILVMTITMGKGCMFSAIPVFIIQGTITLLASLLAPYVTDLAMSYLSMVGSIMIFCIGLNLVWDKKMRVANLMPALIIAVLAAFI